MSWLVTPGCACTLICLFVSLSVWLIFQRFNSVPTEIKSVRFSHFFRKASSRKPSWIKSGFPSGELGVGAEFPRNDWRWIHSESQGQSEWLNWPGKGQQSDPFRGRGSWRGRLRALACQSVMESDSVAPGNFLPYGGLGLGGERKSMEGKMQPLPHTKPASVQHLCPPHGRKEVPTFSVRTWAGAGPCALVHLPCIQPSVGRESLAKPRHPPALTSPQRGGR